MSVRLSPLQKSYTNKSYTIFSADDTWDYFALDFLREMLVIASTEEEVVKATSFIPPKLPDAINSKKLSEDDTPKVPTTLSTTVIDELD